MRTLASFALVALLAFPLSGCGALGMFGGAPDLTAIEVAGRYEFTTFTLDPVSDAVRDYRALGEEVSEDLTLFLQEDGTVRLERLRGDRVDEVMARGTYEIRGRTVRVSFDDGTTFDTVRSNGGAVEEIFLPSEIDFEGGDERLKADIFREAVNLERVSNDYRGITRADVTVRVELREIG